MAVNNIRLELFEDKNGLYCLDISEQYYRIHSKNLNEWFFH